MGASSSGATGEIVLVGGGHAHVHVMKALAERPLAGWRVTLVSPGRFTPYSGMLPGFVAGHYTLEEAHIDVDRLAAWTGTRFIVGAARGLHRSSRHVVLEDGGTIPYDLCSLDVGIAPALGAIEGAETHAIAVKPIASFVEKLERLKDEALSPGGPRRIAVIGGGAGGVELMLSLHARLRREAAAVGMARNRFSFVLVTAEILLPTHNERVRAAFHRQFVEKGIELHENRPVAAVEAVGLRLADGERIAAEAVLVTTHASAPAWFSGTGLALDRDGFIAVGPTLQSLNDRHVFAAGDCAGLVETPREKAGVYSVRAGPPLARNLRSLAEGRPPLPWRPQKRHLALISTGEKYAVASRGPVKAEGAWLWHLKDWIDRRWVRQYRPRE